VHIVVTFVVYIWVIAVLSFSLTVFVFSAHNLVDNTACLVLTLPAWGVSL